VIIVTASQTTAAEKRAIVVVVGTQSNARAQTVRTFMDGGHSVVMCAGPPGCALLREDRCALVDSADAVVLMPRASGDRLADAALSMCAKAARCAVVIDGSTTAPWPIDAIQVGADDLEGVARGLVTARAN
jgi:hypothetical protein